MDRNRTVAGLDVRKDSIYLCIMQQGGQIIFEKTYGVLTPELRQICLDMLDRGVTEAAMESTAVYWVPVWNELCGLMVLKLVNLYFIKQLPGRKSDVKDSQWCPIHRNSCLILVFFSKVTQYVLEESY